MHAEQRPVSLLRHSIKSLVIASIFVTAVFLSSAFLQRATDSSGPDRDVLGLELSAIDRQLTEVVLTLYPTAN